MLPFRRRADEGYFYFDVSISELSIWNVSIRSVDTRCDYDISVRSVDWRFLHFVQVLTKDVSLAIFGDIFIFPSEVLTRNVSVPYKCSLWGAYD